MAERKLKKDGKPRKNTRTGNLDGSIRYIKEKKLWEGRIQIGEDKDGNPIRPSVYDKDRNVVVEKLAELRKQAIIGNEIQSEDMTLEELGEQFLNRIEVGVKETTYVKYCGLIRGRIINELGNLPINEITDFHIQKFVSGMAKKFAPATVRETYFLLKRIFEWAVKKKKLRENPCKDITIPKYELPEISALTEEQLNDVLNTGTPLMRVAMYLGATTGLRRGEVLGLKWADINFEQMYLTVKRTYSRAGKKNVISTPKTAASNGTVVLDETQLAVLENWREQCPTKSSYVFPTRNGTPIAPRNFQRSFQNIVKKKGLKGTRWHDLRHTHASILNEKGVSSKVIQERLRHKDPRMTNRYTHVRPEFQRLEVKKMTDGVSFSPAPPPKHPRKKKK